MLATSTDPFVPVDGGKEPGPGHTVARVEEAMQRRAFAVGKPNAYMLTRLAGLGAVRWASTVIVGDSPAFDVKMGISLGALTALLVSEGESIPTGSLTPTWCIHRLEELLTLVKVEVL